jgi:hypothetical protein
MTKFMAKKLSYKLDCIYGLIKCIWHLQFFKNLLNIFSKIYFNVVLNLFSIYKDYILISKYNFSKGFYLI